MPTRYTWVWDGALAEAARERAGLSRISVAQAMGYATPEPVRRHEVSLEERNSGSRVAATPSAERVGVLAGVLGCSPADFYRRVPVSAAGR